MTGDISTRVSICRLALLRLKGHNHNNVSTRASQQERRGCEHFQTRRFLKHINKPPIARVPRRKYAFNAPPARLCNFDYLNAHSLRPPKVKIDASDDIVWLLIILIT